MTSGPVSTPVQTAFDEVLSTMGSVRTERFDRLRAMPEMRAYAAELAAFSDMDKESPAFEVDMRALQGRVRDEASSGS